MTRILLTRIPMSKSTVLISFHCDECGYHNNEVRSAEKASEMGTKFTVTVNDKQEMSRQIMKSEFATISIPELEFEIPAGTQQAEISNIEGILVRAIEGLQYFQEARMRIDPVQAVQVAEFVVKMKSLMEGEKTFTIVIDDPSGTSFVEPLKDFHVDNNVIKVNYHRTIQQDKALGFLPDDFNEDNSVEGCDVEGEVFELQTVCPQCEKPVEIKNKITDIPNFERVLIMATNCDNCGYKSNEVKLAGGISKTGVIYKLLVKVDSNELQRDVIISDNAVIEIPELDLETGIGTMCGVFTTIEGLLTSTKDKLSSNTILALGDSADVNRKQTAKTFFDKLDACIQGKLQFTIKIEDISGLSFVQSECGTEADKLLSVERFERTWEQNEELGINELMKHDQKPQ